MSISSRPTWLYKPINVDNLQTIQKEFKHIHTTYMDDLFDIAGKDIDRLWKIDKDLIKTHAPTFIELLKKLNLLDRWALTAFSPTVATYTKSMVHIDNADRNIRSYGLNLPIQNCEGSYTVFYETKGKGTCGIMPWYKDSPCFLDHEIIGELGRLPTLQPAFVNVSYPHGSLSEHEDFRLLISTRFFPEIHDYDFDLLDFNI